MVSNFKFSDLFEDKLEYAEYARKQSSYYKEYQQLIDEAVLFVKSNLKLENSSLHKSLRFFHTVKDLKAVTLDSMRLRSSEKELHVSLVQYYSSYRVGKNSNAGTDQYIFGYITLKNNYPKTYIHKETIRDKIEDVFEKIDVDFDHCKEFSRKFEVLTEDKNQLHQLLRSKNLDVLANFPDMELEFLKNTFLYRSSRKAISLVEANIFCELTKVLLDIFD
ncbi:MAG: hypothetical protein JNJ85_08915 [Candidatus Kapabacteria bacterium]|nr:hypothetical protein [Candidatus Kapabacteria bacterium]